ncbi:DNA-directed RNA polymerase subunit alpha, partial [Patescibacteria group bacterium]|nr:DNA-directed RNA polymerase subunit alpha [Patescibacteria group bacterium]
LSSRARNALIQAKKTTIKDLKDMTDLELKNIKGLGPKTVQEIQDKLKELKPNVKKK